VPGEAADAAAPKPCACTPDTDCDRCS
jgi:hypothetical protein